MRKENIHFYVEMHLAGAHHRLALMYICCHRTIITIQFHRDNLLVT